jgi:hypothetical protein
LLLICACKSIANLGACLQLLLREIRVFF